MAINTSKVVAGGIVAGIIMTVVDMASYMFIVGDQMTADLNAFKPGLGDMMASQGTGQMVGMVIMNLIVGMLLIWTYAGFRPRFGPGPRTAVYAALTFFAFGLIMTSNYLMMGMMGRTLWLTYGVIWLVCLIVATMAGAKIYSEEGSTG
jgi:hypothetical protein